MINLIEENGTIKTARKVIRVYAGKWLVSKMLKEEGKEIVNWKGIVERAMEFYEKLYKIMNMDNKRDSENQQRGGWNRYLQ